METTQPRPKTTPKDFFLYLAIMAMLYISVGALIALWFNYIDYLFPDKLQYGGIYDFYSGSIRWYLALLITMFPAFAGTAWYAGRELMREPEKREIAIRKWLLHFTVFVAGASMLIDVVVLLNTFLGGEITTRFILKVLAVLVVAGAVVAYYLLDLRGATARNPHLLNYFTGAAGAIILASIIGGFFIVGSPTSQRALRFDQMRVSDLQSIQWQVISYWQQKDRLPAKIEDLNDPISGYSVPRDPESSEVYTYTPKGRLSFELCATFVKDGSSMGANYPKLAPPAYPMDIASTPDNWQHGAGKTCFERTIDPDRYPPTKGKF